MSESRIRVPHSSSQGFDLPNGWRITPAGKTIPTIGFLPGYQHGSEGKEIDQMGDLVLKLTTSADGRVLVATHGGWFPNGIEVYDTKTQKETQHINLPSSWLGLTWSADGRSFYVAGGNASGDALQKRWPGEPSSIYEFSFENGRFSEKPVAKLHETIDSRKVWWSGVAYLPGRNLLYAANRGMGNEASNVVVFDAKTRQIVTRIPVEVNPYETLLTPDNKYLFVSNWSSQSVSVVDTSSNKVIRTLHVGLNPNDMKLSSDGRLFVACSNDNAVYVIDTRKLAVIERLSTTLTPMAPEGSTPNAIAIDNTRKLLYVANADNNSVAVADIANQRHSNIIGFIPTGWYPSALALTANGRTLYIGTSKGEQSRPDPDGPYSPRAKHNFIGGDTNVKATQPGSLEVLSVADLKAQLPHWTHQVVENTPYNDSLLSEARKPLAPSIIPQQVGVSTPIKHIIYIIKENRTYDQVFGDLSQANGDPALAIFGEKVTPNQHALAREYVTLDNLYCDGEVSVDGHSWSDAAYATDFNEKQWPTLYGGWGTWNVVYPEANLPASGYLWDLARRKGLTYRSYGEDAERASTATTMDAPNARGLAGHVSREFGMGLNVRDTTRVANFLREFREYEANYDSADPDKRLPNFVIMSLPEDHTEGTKVGQYTPTASVANNDYAIGQLVDAVSHSRYWPDTAIFLIEDDAQDGSDHVDARRTMGLVLSPYVKRGIVDSTLYSTSSMVRSIELLLGLPPMSQYDAAAMPMYASFGTTLVVTPFNVIKPLVDVTMRNTPGMYGTAASAKMDFSAPDRAPMHALNEIIWKSVKGNDSPMPAPVHRFRPLVDVAVSADGDKD